MFARLTTAALLAAGLAVSGAALASADPITATVDAGADVAADVNAAASVLIDLKGICIRIGDLVIIGCQDECPEAEAPEVP